MAYKVIYVEAHFQPVGELRNLQVPTGEKDSRGRERLKREERWVQTGYSDGRVDGKRLAEDLQRIADTLDSDGYEIAAMLPLISGAHTQFSWDSAAGYSYTEGVIVMSRKA